jgi:hypothetical protein
MQRWRRYDIENRCLNHANPGPIPPDDVMPRWNGDFDLVARPCPDELKEFAETLPEAFREEKGFRLYCGRYRYDAPELLVNGTHYFIGRRETSAGTRLIVVSAELDETDWVGATQFRLIHLCTTIIAPGGLFGEPRVVLQDVRTLNAATAYFGGQKIKANFPLALHYATASATDPAAITFEALRMHTLPPQHATTHTLTVKIVSDKEVTYAFDPPLEERGR